MEIEGRLVMSEILYFRVGENGDNHMFRVQDVSQAEDKYQEQHGHGHLDVRLI